MSQLPAVTGVLPPPQLPPAPAVSPGATQSPPASSRPRRGGDHAASAACLLVTAAAGLAYAAADGHPFVRGLLYLGLNAAVVVVLLWVVWCRRGGDRGPLVILLAAEAVYLVSNTGFYLSHVLGWGLGVPSIVDAGFFSSCALFVWALVRCVRAVQPKETLDSLDVLVVAGALMLAVWQCLLAPKTSELDGLTALTLLAYPAFLLVLLGTGIRLALVSRLGVPHLLLGGWLSFELMGDLYLTTSAAAGTYAVGSTWDLLWFASWGLLAAAALHPAVGRLWEPGPARQPRVRGRLLLLGAALVLPPVLLQVAPTARHASDSLRVTAAVMVLMVVLVIVRLSRLMSDLGEHRRRHEELAGRADLEVQTRHTQKLEALGRLSAGLAHEINTPIQFVGDNTRFLASAYETMLGLVVAQRDLLSGTSGPMSWEDRRSAQAQAERAADLEWLEAEVPTAVAQSLEGIERVATLVRAMKSFAYKDHDDAVPADLNEALRTTVTVASNETKYVADVELCLGELPPVRCSIGHLNQVFLNLLVNAADAISSTGRRGAVRVVTTAHGDEVLVEFIDDGPGIPAEIRDRVFEPFFTTKEVGRGTGQGLAMARSVVEDKHGGRLVLLCPPVGTVFQIWLPVAGRPVDAAVAR